MNSVMCIKTSYSAHPWFCKGSGKEGSKEVYSCWKFLQVLLRPTCDWGRGVFLWFFLNPLTECILLWQAPRPIGQSCLRPTGASSEPKGSGSSTTETAGQTGGTMKRAGRECHLLSHPPPHLCLPPLLTTLLMAAAVFLHGVLDWWLWLDISRHMTTIWRSSDRIETGISCRDVSWQTLAPTLEVIWECLKGNPGQF